MHTKKIAVLIGIILGVNLGVTVLRFVLAADTGSTSIAADAWHAATDSAANIVALIALCFAYGPADRKHPWGHKKIENLALLAIGGLLFYGSVQVVLRVLDRISGGEAPMFSSTAFMLLLATLGINAVVAFAERTYGKRWNSALLVADARHTTADLLASIAVLAGFGLTRFGVTFLDPFASIAIIAIIWWMAWPLIWNNCKALIDAAVYDTNTIALEVKKVPGVLDCHDIRSRHGVIQLHIELPPSMTLLEAHNVSHAIEGILKKKFSTNLEVVITTEPHGQE